jgi:MoxR-like ATPase
MTRAAATAATATTPPADVDDLAARCRALRERALGLVDDLGRVVVGQDDVVRQVLTAVLAGGHVLLEGPPGVAKTLLVKAFARGLDLVASRIQFTPDLMPADITGGLTLRPDGGPGPGAIEFQPGPLFANLVLADEINRTTPRTQSALLEAMQERQVTAGGRTHPLPDPFCVLATLNPFEMEGTYPLPEAQQDRFLMKVRVGAPDRETLLRILDVDADAALATLGPRFDATLLRDARALAARVPAPPSIKERIADLVQKTAPGRTDGVRLGVSPRGAQAWLRCARVHALLSGRFNVAGADLDATRLPALRHRVILGYEAEARGLDVDALLAAL